MDNSTKIGMVTGTGAAINVSLGFVPDWVKVVNVTDGTRMDEWFAGMPDGQSIATVAAAGPVKNTSNGISAFAGGPTPAGFTIGSAISTAAKQLYYIAIRTSSGA